MPSLSIPAAIAAAAVVGGGATLLASGNASSASQHATDQSIALQNAQYAQTRQDEQPYVQAGYGAVNALTSRLGLNTAPAATATGTATGAPATAQPDYSQYLAANPDVASEAQRVVASGQFPSVGAYLQWHDANYGGENRTSYTNPTATNALTGSADVTPTTAATAPTMATPTSGGTNVLTGAQTSPALNSGPGVGPLAGVNLGAEQMVTSHDPAVPSTGAPATTQATSTAEPGVYGNPNPTYTDPGKFSTTPYTPGTYNEPAAFTYGASDYTASPAYQYTVDQALKGALASSSATGALQSGATLKALQDRASNLAYGDFNNERNFAYQNYNDQRTFDRNVYTDNRNFGQSAYEDSRNSAQSQFNTDRAFNYGQATDARNYLTGEYNVGTGNLFQLANLGQGAASGVAAAGQNATNGTVNALTSNAATSANAGIAGANAVNSFVGSGVNALAYSQGRAGAVGGASPTYSATSYPGLNY